MLKIGITGGIGSGKSTLCKIFEVLQIPVFDADAHAKQLYITNQLLKAKLIKRYGEQLYKNDGFQRKELAKIVFNDETALADLNAMVHPLVIQQSEDWFAQQKGPYAIKEAALMIESGGHKNVDRLIVVQANKETRVQRVMQRDQVTREGVEKRMAKQLPEEDKLQFANYVITNNDQNLLIEQVMSIHNQILQI